MATVIKYALLPFKFDVDRMKEEVAKIDTQWGLHYKTTDYEGEWSAVPLHSIGGSMTNLFVDSSGKVPFQETPLMQLCPYLKSVVETLQCPKFTVRLLKLKAGSVIKEHRDRELFFESGEARIHVPIVTNEQVEFYLDGERIDLHEGECWYMNFNLMHKIINNSNQDRIHLVIDCIVNDWMKETFALEATQQVMTTVADKFSLSDRRAIVESLKAQGTPTALEMAAQMELELEKSI